ncbi:hypothetical protein T310_7458 [Rasamsonia emersonii CBS 393.64]|uniref:S-adenosyl-L-methionine-dependent methyltransferase n=1 Tax=Rasamsonia emersonii (strain ATCC 16479 / CBS 393.64 / IMI 116815) TaxID=1408163 RepID=A0A0F4YK37_RASE3|nr:hypothetical protein T310_7458 [Rasamsonia emersonii CBS 393.64]KKA18599.1 hypothetical protein T310_7458 [Rasamsonia emersonii CBS 393.64]
MATNEDNNNNNNNAPIPADENNDPITVDENFDSDSAYGGDDWNSGLTENGRREYICTTLNTAVHQSDTDNDAGAHLMTNSSKQWKQGTSLPFHHFMYLVMDYHEENRLFRSPIGPNPQHILDIGTGKGSWALLLATVRGVDLYPPPVSWVPPNCILEVDDVLEDWTYRQPFDLIHMRLLLGAFTPEEWDRVYKQCYDNLKPGGWIEQVELDVRVMSDDGSLPPDSLLAGWGPTFLGCGERSGRPLDTQLTMRAAIEKAGFVDVHEKLYKCPIGAWPKDPVLKDAGAINMEHWTTGLEGWAMWLLTKYGAPKPWTSEEVRVYVAKVRNELRDPKLHIWHYTRRVWAKKPETTTTTASA